MTEMGFQLDNLGGGSYAVNGVPAGIEGLNAVTLITDIGCCCHRKWYACEGRDRP